MPKNPWSIRFRILADQKNPPSSAQPSKSGSESMVAQRAAVGQLVELGLSVFHKFGRLQVLVLVVVVVVVVQGVFFNWSRLKGSKYQITW